MVMKKRGTNRPWGSAEYRKLSGIGYPKIAQINRILLPKNGIN